VIASAVDIDLEEDIEEEISDGMYDFLLDGAQFGQNVSMERVPEDRGQLRMSLAQFVPEVRDGEVVWGVGGQPHAAPMEFGTEPYWPPIKPLKEWARRVGGDEGLAYAVQRKIASVGITAQPYLRPGAEAQANWYRRHDLDKYVDDRVED
jgi:hypothetical protein